MSELNLSSSAAVNLSVGWNCWPLGSLATQGYRGESHTIPGYYAVGQSDAIVDFVGIPCMGLHRGAASVSTGDRCFAKTLLPIRLAAGVLWLGTLNCVVRLRTNGS